MDHNRNTETDGETHPTCGQQSAGTFSNDSTEQNTSKGHWNTVYTCHEIILLKENPMVERRIEPSISSSVRNDVTTKPSGRLHTI